MTLSSSMIAKLRRLLPMLGSSHDGEVIATRNAIVRELASGNRDLHDLAAAISPGAESPQLSAPQTAPSFVEMARKCRDIDHGRLASHEREFVANMCKSTWPPTEKQERWLGDLYRRLNARAAA